MPNERLYLRQLLAGRDFAQSNPVAAQMVNFVYLIGDLETRECVVVDPAWAIADLLDIVAADDMKLTGVLASHFHPDHIGGDLMGMATVEGIRELLDQTSVPIHCHADETEWILRTTEVSRGDLSPAGSGDSIQVGDIPITFLHTPGHTPGSQCFLVENRLIAGDTLFLEGCGRTDFPGGDREEMFRTLHERLARLPDDTILYPGHRYSPADSAPLGDVRAQNTVFRMKTLDDWLRFV